MGKKLTFLMFLVFAVSLVASAVNAETVTSGNLADFVGVKKIEIDGDDSPSSNIQIDRGEEIEIELILEALTDYDVEDIEVEARIGRGYRYADEEFDSLIDIESLDLDSDSTEKVRLYVEVPMDMELDENDYLYLTISAAGQFDPIMETYRINVEGIQEEDAVQVARASFSPDVVKAGFGFTALVRVENYGEDNFDDVCATVEVIGLSGAKDTECIDELDADESETLEEFAIRIPEDAKPGVYDVEVTVEFDKYEGTTYYGTIEVIEGYNTVDQTEKAKLLVNIPDSLQAIAGSKVTYPVTVSNLGSADTTVTLVASNADAFGMVRFEPSNLLILEAGETKSAMLTVEVSEEAEGIYPFLLSVQADGDSKQVALEAVVAGTSSDDLRRGLEIGLIILVVILILLGLIVGFTRMRKHDGEDETQTYY